MRISYNKLWIKLIEHGMKKMDLIAQIGIGTTTLAKLSKNQTVSMDVMCRLCELFNCNIGEIMDIFPNENIVQGDK